MSIPPPDATPPLLLPKASLPSSSRPSSSSPPRLGKTLTTGVEGAGPRPGHASSSSRVQFQSPPSSTVSKPPPPPPPPPTSASGGPLSWLEKNARPRPAGVPAGVPPFLLGDRGGLPLPLPPAAVGDGATLNRFVGDGATLNPFRGLDALLADLDLGLGAATPPTPTPTPVVAVADAGRILAGLAIGCRGNCGATPPPPPPGYGARGDPSGVRLALALLPLRSSSFLRGVRGKAAPTDTPPESLLALLAALPLIPGTALRPLLGVVAVVTAAPAAAAAASSSSLSASESCCAMSFPTFPGSAKKWRFSIRRRSRASAALAAATEDVGESAPGGHAGRVVWRVPSRGGAAFSSGTLV